jgi:hypothetical protein
MDSKIDRRSLFKLIVLSGAVLRGPIPFTADSMVQAADAGEEVRNRRRFRHPRLFYDTASLERLRRWLAANPKADHALKRHGHDLMEAKFIPESVATKGPGQQENYGAPGDQISEMGLTLGLLYHLTGDRQYAEKLRDAMFYYAHYTHWTAPSFFHRSPPWHSELDTSNFGFGYAVGYDALHDTLSIDDRKRIANAIVSKAVLPILDDWILPGKRIQSFESMGHNWWGVCVSGGGLCALALLGDDPRAQTWIDAVDAGYIQWFSYQGNVLQNRVPTFERSGPSYEGVGYTDYGVSEYLHYRLAWQNTYPGRSAPRMEPLEHLARFFLHTIYPTSTGSYAVNFNDSGIVADSVPTILLLIACGLGTPEASRYLQLVHMHPQGSLLTLLRQYVKPAPSIKVPTSYAYPKMGWAMMRTSWDNDATFLAMKSGYTWNHAHADAGSFMLFDRGVPLIIDSGLCSYYRPEYTTYYRRSEAHNVILYNGQGQPEDDLFLGCKFPGRLHDLIDGLGLKYVYADATGPMARWFTRNYRHWIWSDDVILIVDDIRAYEPGKLEWLLHYQGNYTVDSEGGVRLKNGPAEAVVKILYPTTARSEAMGFANEDSEKKVPYLVFTHKATGKLCQFITAICLNPASIPNFEVKSTENQLSVRIQKAETEEEIVLDRRAIRTPGTISMTIGNYITDAYLVHFKRGTNKDKHAIDRYFMCDGSYLRHNGRSIIESLSKLTACWSLGSMPEIYSNDSPHSIQIAAKSPIDKVRWNDRVVLGTYDPTNRLITLDNRPGVGATKKF